MKTALSLMALLLGSLAAVLCGNHAGARPADLSDGGEGLLVASLNLAMERDAETIVREITEAPSVRRAGVLLLQEAVNSPKAKEGVPGDLARSLGMRLAFSPEAPGVYDRGLAILSRYPIRDVHVLKLKVFNLRFYNRARFALAATIDTPLGPVRFWNVHLDTRLNARDRIEQLSPVVAEAAAAPGPKVIAGDFNTNYFYWVWNVLPVPGFGDQGQALRDYMKRRGFHAPLQDRLVTFKKTGMHLDWVFAQGLTAKAAAVDTIGFSDHNAVIVRFEPSRQNAGFR